MTLTGKFGWTVLTLQLFFIIIFAIFVKYGSDLDASDPIHTKLIINGGQDPKDNSFNKNYPIFQDINALIFIGIAYLYAFLKKYSLTGIGMNFLLCAISVQWGIITMNWWNMKAWKMEVDVLSLVHGEFAAASAMIALGGVFGKVGLLQMIVFAILEVLVYSTVNHFSTAYLQVSDVGEAVGLHFFAGVFGCSAAYAVDRKLKVEGNPNEGTSYSSNIFCILGTLVLWVFWPSFNAAGDEGDSQHRSVLNTYLALIGSCIMCFAASALLHKDNKFTMSHIQNGSLAGAVAVGAVSNLMIQPFGALLIGASAGCLCVTGLKYFSPFLARQKIYDPCGINSLHGLPGLFGGILAILATVFANEETYGFSLYKFYPAMAPPENTTAFLEFQENSPMEIEPGIGRTPQSQAIYQCIYIVFILISSSLSGLLTGAILRLKMLDPIEDKHMYQDDIIWDLSDIEINILKQTENPNPGQPVTSKL